MFQDFSYKVQVNIKLTQCTYKLWRHELSCQNRHCKTVDKGFPRTVSNGSSIPMYTWPKNGSKRFPKARTIWNCLKLVWTWLTLPTTNPQNGSKRFLGPHVPKSFLSHVNYLTYSLQLSPQALLPEDAWILRRYLHSVHDKPFLLYCHVFDI